jgi:hypothetical protein
MSSASKWLLQSQMDRARKGSDQQEHPRPAFFLSELYIQVEAAGDDDFGPIQTQFGFKFN